MTVRRRHWPPRPAATVPGVSTAKVRWYLVYAMGGQSLSRYLQRVSVRKLFNRVTGGAFVGFALLMAGVRE
jgi:threonine/homoserine/homoserine lactone efflux protein